MKLNPRWLTISSFVAAGLAHLVLLTPMPYVLQALGMLTLCCLLPGLLLVEIVVGRSSAPPAWLERIALSSGIGYSVLIFGMLLLSYVPGPLHTWHVYLAYDLVLVLLLAVLSWPLLRRSKRSTALDGHGSIDHITLGPTTGVTLQGWVIVALLLMLVVGGVLRFGNLGYAEFHGDEARAVLRGAAVIQGYDDVLMLHKKGPAEILLPTATFALTGRVTEVTARLPFAFAGLTVLLAAFVIGKRLSGLIAGFSAALLLMVDGYMVAFSRIVQYQSIVILTSVLVVLILYRLYQHPVALRNYLLLASVLLASGILAHYEAALSVIPALYLFAALIRRYPEHRTQATRALVVAGSVGVALVALFYVPYISHPQFQATYVYLMERRIGLGGDGAGLPANNLADFFTRTTIYNSTYFVVFLIVLAWLGFVTATIRGMGKRWGGVVSALITVIAIIALLNRGWMMVGRQDWTVLIFAIAFGLMWFVPRMQTSERSVWLWFGALFLLIIFLTAKPRTHVYVFMTPWVLLAGLTLERAWRVLRMRTTVRTAALAASASAVMLTLLFGAYTYLYFVYTDTEILRTWQENRPRIYWTTYDTLDNRALFGFPLANGWKVPGRLYAEDVVDGPFATNEFEFWTPIWYTRGEWRCEDQAEWFFQIFNPQPDPEGYAHAIESSIRKDFEPWGRVTIGGDPRMIIHKRSQEPLEEQTLRLEDYESDFDDAASAWLPLSYPVVEPLIANPLHVNLGDAIWLEGYELDTTYPLQPGEVISLTLFWRAQRSIDKSYKVFNQAYYGDGAMIAQQDGYPVCGARGTWMWDPGELVVDRYLLRVADDAPDGLYPLYTGMYIEETFERLPVVGSDGEPAGDQVHIADIRVGVE